MILNLFDIYVFVGHSKWTENEKTNFSSKNSKYTEVLIKKNKLLEL